MQLLIPTIKEYLPDWNERIHTEIDAYDFCAKHKIITLDSEHIEELGEYRIRNDKPYIILHKFILDRYRNWVFHHEIGHFILHPTSCASFSDNVQKVKVEKEAHFVSAIALIPRCILETKKLPEIADEFGFPHKVILFRKWIYDNFGKI